MLTRRDLFSVAPVLLTRAQAQVTPDLLRFRPEIEPLVALIERTPREKCAETAAAQLRRGTGYRQLMAALFLAGVRNVNPRPPGFALHCVFVVHSAHLLGLEAPPGLRLLPLFYALDNFKLAQDRDARQTAGDYTMRPLRGPLPEGERAAAEFAAAMESWDGERAERAVVALARSRGPAATFEELRRYGARDYRNIGHKAIYVANASRTLEAIGWQYAEPVLRSLVLALLDFGREQKVNGYAFEDQCYHGNRKRARETFGKLGGEWAADRPDAAATRSAIEVLREAPPEEACAEVARRVAKSGAGCAWDAIHLAAAELMMRQPGIVGLHAVTSANALHHAYLAASEPATRYFLLLQGAGWMGQFRAWAEQRGDKPRARAITDLEPPSGSGDNVLEELFAAIPNDVDGAASRALALGRDPASRRAFFAAAIRNTLTKADEVHHYKYLAALIEDVPLVSAEWQAHLVAAVPYYMKGAQAPEAAPMKRAREALRQLES